jgi:hypothetical protein
MNVDSTAQLIHLKAKRKQTSISVLASAEEYNVRGTDENPTRNKTRITEHQYNLDSKKRSIYGTM